MDISSQCRGMLPSGGRRSFCPAGHVLRHACFERGPLPRPRGRHGLAHHTSCPNSRHVIARSPSSEAIQAPRCCPGWLRFARHDGQLRRGHDLWRLVSLANKWGHRDKKLFPEEPSRDFAKRGLEERPAGTGGLPEFAAAEAAEFCYPFCGRGEDGRQGLGRSHRGLCAGRASADGGPIGLRPLRRHSSLHLLVLPWSFGAGGKARGLSRAAGLRQSAQESQRGQSRGAALCAMAQKIS